MALYFGCSVNFLRLKKRTLHTLGIRCIFLFCGLDVWGGVIISLGAPRVTGGWWADCVLGWRHWGELILRLFSLLSRVALCRPREDPLGDSCHETLATWTPLPSRQWDSIWGSSCLSPWCLLLSQSKKVFEHPRMVRSDYSTNPLQINQAVWHSPNPRRNPILPHSRD